MGRYIAASGKLWMIHIVLIKYISGWYNDFSNNQLKQVNGNY